MNRHPTLSRQPLYNTTLILLSAIFVGDFFVLLDGEQTMN